MLYEHYLDLAAGVDRLIKSLQTHPDARVRDEVEQLLQRLDLLHREGLVRLADALRSAGAGDIVTRAAADPIVRILLGLYGLIELETGSGDSTVGFVPLQQLRTRRTGAAVDSRDAQESKT
jgi:hypothetical protein